MTVIFKTTFISFSLRILFLLLLGNYFNVSFAEEISQSHSSEGDETSSQLLHAFEMQLLGEDYKAAEDLYRDYLKYKKINLEEDSQGLAVIIALRILDGTPEKSLAIFESANELQKNALLVQSVSTTVYCRNHMYDKAIIEISKNIDLLRNLLKTEQPNKEALCMIIGTYFIQKSYLYAMSGDFEKSKEEYIKSEDFLVSPAKGILVKLDTMSKSPEKATLIIEPLAIPKDELEKIESDAKKSEFLINFALKITFRWIEFM